MRHGGKYVRTVVKVRKKLWKKTPVNYNCRALLKHDSGAGERKRERFKG